MVTTLFMLLLLPRLRSQTSKPENVLETASSCSGEIDKCYMWASRRTMQWGVFFCCFFSGTNFTTVRALSHLERFFPHRQSAVWSNFVADACVKRKKENTSVHSVTMTMLLPFTFFFLIILLFLHYLLHLTLSH